MVAGGSQVGRYSWPVESGPGLGRQGLTSACLWPAGGVQGQRRVACGQHHLCGWSPPLLTSLGPAQSSPARPDTHPGLRPDLTGERGCMSKMPPSAQIGLGFLEKCQGRHPSLHFLGAQGPCFRCDEEWAPVTWDGEANVVTQGGFKMNSWPEGLAHGVPCSGYTNTA